MNALAVEIAAREGARIVWMPTVDSPAETAGRTEPKPGDKVPLWASLQHELHSLGLSIEPVCVTDGDGQTPSGDARGVASDRASRVDPGHGASRARRHVRRGRCGPRGGREARCRHAPRVSVPGLLDRRSGRARESRLPARALPQYPAQRQDDVGAMAACSNCGEQNPGGARFCVSCGSPQAAPTCPELRRGEPRQGPLLPRVRLRPLAPAGPRRRRRAAAAGRRRGAQARHARLRRPRRLDSARRAARPGGRARRCSSCTTAACAPSSSATAARSRSTSATRSSRTSACRSPTRTTPSAPCAPRSRSSTPSPR